MTDCCEHDIEPPVSKKGGTFPDDLSDSDSQEALCYMRLGFGFPFRKSCVEKRNQRLRFGRPCIVV